MAGQRVDDRSDDQVAKTACLVVMTDSFLSGWGGAPRRSYAAWPVYRGSDPVEMVRRVGRRSDAKRVRTADASGKTITPDPSCDTAP